MYEKEKSLLNSLTDKKLIEDEIINKEIFKEVKDIVNNLSKKEQKLIFLAFNDNVKLSQEQIAKELNMSQSTTSRRLKKTLQTIRNKYDLSKKSLSF